MSLLLVCTVGGAPEPIAASLCSADPEYPSRVVFVCSSSTRATTAQVLELASRNGSPVREADCDFIEISNPQDLGLCIQEMRDRVGAKIQEWLNGHPGANVVVDFTGGTKAMSAAMALATQRGAYQFRYVGGTERTKGGVGVVIDGKEQIVQSQNPWNSLGLLHVEDALTLADCGDFEAAHDLLATTLHKVSDGLTKRTLNALDLLIGAYASWDRFDHQAAANKLKDIREQKPYLERVLGPPVAEQVLRTAQGHLVHLEAAAKAASQGLPSKELVADLMGNAERRERQRRYDDSAGRLYRATEAIAQYLLYEKYKIQSTGEVPVDKCPPSFLQEFKGKSKNGILVCGLQEAWNLLFHLGDPAAEKFREGDLHSRKSILHVRNQSIFAHGFAPITKDAHNTLKRNVKMLATAAGIDLNAIPSFPKFRS
jgi:CRISPR-associated protein (TIGR02710 family)